MNDPFARCRLAIHGGAGVIDVEQAGGSSDDQVQALATILQAAWERLASGENALETVQFAVCALEDCELFNAGRGSVLNRDAIVEMDAAIMDGRSRQFGAVAAVTAPRNPVRAARAVLEHDIHALLAGAGGDAFARASGLACEPPEYFVVPLRARQLRLAARSGRVSLDHDEGGTVGAVARDRDGNLAAATSTGGMTNKLPGRVGDTPLIGAGTWADNETCAVSATGEGEALMRALAAYDLHARIGYRGESLEQAATAVLARIRALGGSGGVIAVDAGGELVTPFNSAGMFRGWVDASGRLQVAKGAAAIGI